MIKGVNKKVIEINDTGNIYFEKAVFYVRSEMSDVPERHLLREVSEYLDENDYITEANFILNKKKKIFVVSIITVLCILMAAVIFALII